MKDKLTKTYSIGSCAFYCDSCGSQRVSTNTTFRVYASGTEVRIDHCDGCKSEQHTEYYKGPTTRLETT